MKQGVFWVIKKKSGFELIFRFDDTRGHSSMKRSILGTFSRKSLEYFAYMGIMRPKLFDGTPQVMPQTKYSI